MSISTQWEILKHFLLYMTVWSGVCVILGVNMVLVLCFLYKVLGSHIAICVRHYTHNYFLLVREVKDIVISGVSVQQDAFHLWFRRTTNNECSIYYVYGAKLAHLCLRAPLYRMLASLVLGAIH